MPRRRDGFEVKEVLTDLSRKKLWHELGRRVFDDGTCVSSPVCEGHTSRLRGWKVVGFVLARVHPVRSSRANYLWRTKAVGVRQYESLMVVLEVHN